MTSINHLNNILTINEFCNITFFAKSYLAIIEPLLGDRYCFLILYMY